LQAVTNPNTALPELNDPVAGGIRAAPKPASEPCNRCLGPANDFIRPWFVGFGRQFRATAFSSHVRERE
jgi:hypothetical protein